MNSAGKLLTVRLVHTIIWGVMALATAWALVASLSGRFDAGFGVAMALIGGEVLVLVANRFKCPLSAVAERYTSNRDPEFDIFLPRWIARHNIRIFCTIFVLGILANLVVHAVRR